MTGREKRGRQDRAARAVGKLRISGVLASEPAGKSLKDCEHGECLVTYDAGGEDQEVRRRFGVTGLRRLKLLRIATEAHEQGIDLTQEDLAYKILNCGLKTIKRDIAYFRRQGLFLPTRGQQKDIGPVLAHQVEAVRMSIEGKTPWEVAKKILHPPRAIARYLAAFARAVALADEGIEPREAAGRLGLSERLYRDMIQLRDRYAGGEHAERLAEILRAPRESEPEREVTSRAARLPIYDEQVKVLRRDFFEFLLQHEVRRATRYHHPLSLLAIELDAAGRDRSVPHTVFSRALAEALRSGLRKTDLVGRLGALRFGAIVAADASGAYQVAERLRAQMAEQGGRGGASLAGARPTISIGGAALAAPDLGPEAHRQLAEMAETMLTQAKDAGGDRTLVHACPGEATSVPGGDPGPSSGAGGSPAAQGEGEAPAPLEETRRTA